MGQARRAPLILLVFALCGAAPSWREVHLVYVRSAGAEACPDEGTLRAAIAARIGASPFREDAAEVVEATVQPSDKGLLARVVLTDKDGQALGRREIASLATDCRELAPAMELAISLAIDPLSALRPMPSPAKPSAETAPPMPADPPAPLPPPAPRVAPPSQEPPTRSFWPDSLSISLAGLVAAGAAPGIAPGLELEVRTRWSFFSVGVSGLLLLPGSAPLRGGRMSATTMAATLSPCLHAAVFSGCLLGNVGGVSVSGEGFPAARGGTAFYSDLGVRAAATVPLHRGISVGAHVDLKAPLARTTLTVGAENEPVWSAPGVSGIFGVGLGWHFF